jgi:predicted GNAT superfamily acetyltransferase
MPSEEQVLLNPTFHGGAPQPCHASGAGDGQRIAAVNRHGSRTMIPDREQVTIRELNSDEMCSCMNLQKRVWRGSDLDVVPHNIFVVAGRAGGLVLGAFERDNLVGFALAFPAVRQAHVYLHSHMTAVEPEFQGQGIGKRLKLAQRQYALARGFDLIEWTFDPLQPGNANFNIVHLGAIVREYLPNCYGSTTSALDSGLPTDRLVAEWWIREPRVEQILEGRPQPTTQARRARVPRRIREICATDAEAARRIQRELRRELEELFQRSFAITGFERDAEYDSYLLERYENREDHAARTSHASQGAF